MKTGMNNKVYQKRNEMNSWTNLNLLTEINAFKEFKTPKARRNRTC